MLHKLPEQVAVLWPPSSCIWSPGKNEGLFLRSPQRLVKATFTAPSVCWGSPYYCDGWGGKREERWPLPPHHLSMNSEQLDRRWGNYTVIITRTCAQAYTLSHNPQTAPYTPDGVPSVFTQWLPPPSFTPSLHHTSLLLLSPLLSSPALHQQGNSSLPGRLASSGPLSVFVWVCVFVCVGVGVKEHLFALYEQVCASACICTCSHECTPLSILALPVSKVCLALGPLQYWQAAVGVIVVPRNSKQVFLRCLRSGNSVSYHSPREPEFAFKALLTTHYQICLSVLTCFHNSTWAATMLVFWNMNENWSYSTNVARQPLWNQNRKQICFPFIRYLLAVVEWLCSRKNEKGKEDEWYQSKLLLEGKCSDVHWNMLPCTAALYKLSKWNHNSLILVAQTLDFLCQTGILVGSTLEWKPWCLLHLLHLLCCCWWWCCCGSNNLNTTYDHQVKESFLLPHKINSWVWWHYW